MARVFHINRLSFLVGVIVSLLVTLQPTASANQAYASTIHLPNQVLSVPHPSGMGSNLGDYVVTGSHPPGSKEVQVYGGPVRPSWKPTLLHTIAGLSSFPDIQVSHHWLVWIGWYGKRSIWRYYAENRLTKKVFLIESQGNKGAQPSPWDGPALSLYENEVAMRFSECDAVCKRTRKEVSVIVTKTLPRGKEHVQVFARGNCDLQQPALWDKILVWSQLDCSTYGSQSVYMKNLATGRVRRLTFHYECNQALTNGRYVAWEQREEKSGATSVVLLDLKSNKRMYASVVTRLSWRGNCRRGNRDTCVGENKLVLDDDVLAYETGGPRGEGEWILAENLGSGKRYAVADSTSRWMESGLSRTFSGRRLVWSDCYYPRGIGAPSAKCYRRLVTAVVPTR